ncbi:MAG: FliH/SctL family protein [Pseudomonadota bacterium]
MASLTFLQNRNFTLSSNSLVYNPDEVNALQSILEQAGEIHRLLTEEQTLIDQAKEKGYDEGYESGQSAGYEAALEHIATKLVTLAKEANAAREELRHSAGDIAIKIVDKIATEIGSRETVKALALSAAKQLTGTEAIVLQVHPDNKAYLIEELLKVNGNTHNIVDVVADPDLGTQDCVLETEYGHIKAGLATQLKVMRNQFYDG